MRSDPRANEPVRLLALDLDGTLLDSKKEISARNLAALHAALDAGVRIALITGRRYPAAKRISASVPGNPVLVLHNGGLVMEGGTPLRVLPLDREVARAVVSFAKDRGADPVVHYGHEGEGLLYVETTSPSHTLLAYYINRSHPDVRVVESLEGELASAARDPLQVMFGGSMKEMEVLAQALEARGLAASALRTVYPEDDLSLIDVVAPHVDKSEALRFLCARFEVDIQQVLAIGDNWNDRDMLLAAGRGCVMGNAEPGLRALGLEVVPKNDDDGVAFAIERHILEPRWGK